MRLKLTLLFASFLASINLQAAEHCHFPTLTGDAPLILGHRGASGYRPEHTLASYRLAMDMGADFIEPDLVVTQDGQLVARHEPNISGTTDIANHPEFSDRRTIKNVDGNLEEGYFVEDFTLAELKTLRAIERLPFRDQSYNGMFEVPTLREIIALVKSYEKETGRRVGIYPETKHPSYFRQQGLALEERLLDILQDTGFTDPKRVFIQSFEFTNLKDIFPALLADRGIKLPLIQLFDEFDTQPYDFVLADRKETYGDLIQRESLLNLVSKYASGIGVWKNSFVKRMPISPAIDLNGDGKAEVTERLTGEVLPVVANAHEAGLLVHTYTLRNEERYIAAGYSSVFDEYQSLIELGVDGFFSDFPDTAFEARRQFCLSTAR